MDGVFLISLGLLLYFSRKKHLKILGLLFLLFPLLVAGKNKLFYFAVLALVVAWSTSISLGYNTPVLFVGNLFMLMVMFYLFLFFKGKRGLRLLCFIPFCFLAIIFFPKYREFRYGHVYRDLHVKELNRNLGDIYAGFSGIYTGERTYDYFRELGELYEKYSEGGKKRIAVVPSNAVFWILVEEENPLNIDWVQNAEHPGKALTESVRSSVVSPKADFVFLNNYEVKEIYKGSGVLNTKAYSVLKDVGKILKIVEKTRYFTVYK